MKLFIFMSFVFLGWVFYVASGGADYAPRPGSLQARVSEKETDPVRDPVRELSESVIPANESTGTSLADLDVSKNGETLIMRASIAAEDGGVIESAGSIEDAGTDLEKVAALTLDTVDGDIAVAEVIPPRDIREVTGKVVNMRDGPGTSFERVGKIIKGTKIEVLEEPGNSWVRLQVLETGETGWIADWLITSAN